MLVYSFCPECLGVFQSRNYEISSLSYGTVTACKETCIFCGSTANSASDPDELKPIILDALYKKMLSSKDVKAVQSVLQQLERGEISLNTAEADIEAISPGLGKRMCGAIRKHGGAALVTLIAALGLYAQFQMVESSERANEISRQALEFAIEQSNRVETLSQGKPSQPKIQNTHPSGPVHENRKARLAKKAKKRKEK